MGFSVFLFFSISNLWHRRLEKEMARSVKHHQVEENHIKESKQTNNLRKTVGKHFSIDNMYNKKKYIKYIMQTPSGASTNLEKLDVNIG